MSGSAALPGLIAPQILEFEGETPLLKGARCAGCGRLSLPAAWICDRCFGTDLRHHRFSATGSLYSFTVVHVASRIWSTPFVLGYVDLTDGIRVLSHIDADPDRIEIGMSMRLAIAEVGRQASGEAIRSYVFRPYGPANGRHRYA